MKIDGKNSLADEGRVDMTSDNVSNLPLPTEIVVEEDNNPHQANLMQEFSNFEFLFEPASFESLRLDRVTDDLCGYKDNFLN